MDEQPPNPIAREEESRALVTQKISARSWLPSWAALHLLAQLGRTCGLISLGKLSGIPKGFGSSCCSFRGPERGTSVNSFSSFRASSWAGWGLWNKVPHEKPSSMHVGDALNSLTLWICHPIHKGCSNDDLFIQRCLPTASTGRFFSFHSTNWKPKSWASCWMKS